MVAGLKYQGKIYDANYRHLQDDVDEWYENKNNIKTTHPSLLGYLRSNYSEDLSLVQAINLVMSRGKPAIFQAYTEAQKHENKKQDLMLMTAHSSKGLEFDEVTIAPDLSSSIDNIVAAAAKGEVEIGEGMSPIDKESLNLYYVAVTRALVRVRNATHL
jgi:ATP-dependent exoDNAse (exonuclease V) beta subunit